MTSAAFETPEIADIYADLLRLARAELRRHRRGETLNTSALVHEAWLKLGMAERQHFENTRHFYASFARVMRQVVVDHARARSAEMRGGGVAPLPLHELLTKDAAAESQAEELVRLDAALNKLAEVDERLVEVVHLRFFAGLEQTEVASLLGVSVPTIKRDSRIARAFLQHELGLSAEAGG
ncbi:MAG: sigma-70 family RNA polymerase sigma factor [Xanthomonadales bacterium]|nr:sigma-70 family RNA polymerase sigma factor [Xanthomonadales bacterium]MCB1627309.1 sigma-70 family RNA polymerase sigma factor [Xanthomonadales bacterium]MCB1633794.1 sigma-70 family RNA polymerase sigma factor [Xanthomonadales bacterium]